MHPKRRRRVDDGAARPVLRAIERALATAVPVAPAAAVVGGVGDGVESVLVGFDKVDLVAIDAADSVGIAIVVAAAVARLLGVGSHGGEIEGRIAAACGGCAALNAAT
tara:strand:- start:1130 stop:1453 length:324 start_codon:yes stop_codon:yes gene_type:complete